MFFSSNIWLITTWKFQLYFDERHLHLNTKSKQNKIMLYRAGVPYKVHDLAKYMPTL